MKKLQLFLSLLILIAVILGCTKEDILPQYPQIPPAIKGSVAGLEEDTTHINVDIIGCYESHHTLLSSTGNPAPFANSIIPVGEVFIHADASFIEVNVKLNASWVMPSFRVTAAADESQLCNAIPVVLNFQPTHTTGKIIVPRLYGTYNVVQVEVEVQRMSVFTGIAWHGPMTAWNQMDPNACINAKQWLRLDFGCCEYAILLG